MRTTLKVEQIDKESTRLHRPDFRDKLNELIDDICGEDLHNDQLEYICDKKIPASMKLLARLGSPRGRRDFLNLKYV